MRESIPLVSIGRDANGIEVFTPDFQINKQPLHAASGGQPSQDAPPAISNGSGIGTLAAAFIGAHAGYGVGLAGICILGAINPMLIPVAALGYYLFGE